MTRETTNSAEKDGTAEAMPGLAREPNQGGALTIDYALYERYLDSSDLSEAEKREFLETLWSIIVSFVDLGFGVHPLQQANPDCGQELNLGDLIKNDPSTVLLSSDNLPHNQFTKAADRQKDRPTGKTES
jgi:hypothetical protein